MNYLVKTNEANLNMVDFADFLVINHTVNVKDIPSDAIRVTDMDNITDADILFIEKNILGTIEFQKISFVKNECQTCSGDGCYMCSVMIKIMGK